MLCLAYTHDAQGHAAPEDECVYIGTSACVMINMLYFPHSKNLKPTAQLVDIVTDADCDYGRLFQHFYDVPNISKTYLIVVISIMGLHSHRCSTCIQVFMAISGKEFHQMNISYSE